MNVDFEILNVKVMNEAWKLGTVQYSPRVTAVVNDVTVETRGGGPHLKGPCWDLGDLIRELEERGARPRQKSPRRPAADCVA